MGNGAVERLLASVFIAFSSAGLAGCAPQSNSGFQAVADPSPSAAAVQRQSPQPATVVPASTSMRPQSNRNRRRRQRGDQRCQPECGCRATGRVSSSVAPVSTADYRIRAGDVLQINVFQLQDFNREAPVDDAGTIALPLIGAVPVAGKTVRQIEAEIAGTAQGQIPSRPAGARHCKRRGWPARRGARGGQKSWYLPLARRHDFDECDRPSQRVQ